MGLFEKIKSGLLKTKESMVKRIDSFIGSFTKIDEEFFEELEEILITSDIGIQTSEKICNQLRDEVKKAGEKEIVSVSMQREF